MKNKTGKIGGFIVGLGGFLFLFKIIILNNTSPSDELAPGIVVLVAILSGFVMALVGNMVQRYLEQKKN